MGKTDVVVTVCLIAIIAFVFGLLIYMYAIEYEAEVEEPKKSRPPPHKIYGAEGYIVEKWQFRSFGDDYWYVLISNGDKHKFWHGRHWVQMQIGDLVKPFHWSFDIRPDWYVEIWRNGTMLFEANLKGV